jgi:hypothetical protein
MFRQLKKMAVSQDWTCPVNANPRDAVGNGLLRVVRPFIEESATPISVIFGSAKLKPNFLFYILPTLEAAALRRL